MEGALGHSGKNRDHGIGAVLLVHIGEVDDVGAVIQEGPAQKLVRHEYVDHLEAIS